jgi:hypothetical protein
MDVAMSSLSLYDLNLWTKAKSPSPSPPRLSSKLATIKRPLFAEFKNKTNQNTKRGIHESKFTFLIFLPLRIQSLRNVDSSQILKVGREEKRREGKSSTYFELPLETTETRPQV